MEAGRLIYDGEEQANEQHGRAPVVGEGGLFPHVVLACWPLFTIALFFFMRPERATLISVFGGLLFLPELTYFKFPLLPTLNKQNITYLSVLLAYTVRRPARVWRLPRETWVTVATLALVASFIGTALTNQDPLVVGTFKKTIILGMDMKDGLAMLMGNLFEISLPFFLGGVIIRSRDDLEHLLRFIVKMGLVYSLLALVELRLSPQLHRWLYGYFQHDFQQTIRYGGFRPTLFMRHGLAVGLFFCVSALAAIALRGTAARFIFRIRLNRAVVWLLIILIACKSTGAILYALVCAPLLLLGKPKSIQRFAAVLAVVVLLYPSMRGAGMFPTDTVTSVADVFGRDREGSVLFRFKNEDLLAKKARQRPVFGWGTYGRNFTYNEGGSVSTTVDGQWIIALGSTGFAGFFTWFGLLVTPIFLAGRRMRRIPVPDRRLVASVSLIVALTALDLLPNSLFSTYPFFLSGALLSASRELSQSPRAYPPFVTEIG